MPIHRPTYTIIYQDNTKTRNHYMVEKNQHELKIVNSRPHSKSIHKDNKVAITIIII